MIKKSNLSIFSKTATGSCKKHINTKFFISLFIGLAICGIPLAVMTTLYIDKSNFINYLIYF